MKALIGKKIGMTQIFTEKGLAEVVTVLDVSNNVIAKAIKSGDNVTHIEIGKDTQKKPNKPDLGNYKEIGFVPVYREAFKINETTEVKLGEKLEATLFELGDLVDVSGTTKGKGFQGVMKRWGFKGGKATHGQSDRDRAPGSIGSGTTIGRVLKGKKMAGRMGREKNTVQKLRVALVDKENGLICIAGPVPGNKGSYVTIQESFFNNYKKI